MAAKADKHSHGGHRQRKKEQFLKKGIEGLSEHEMLEFMLYYSIPYGDTNDIAHDLICRFGNLRGVINAAYDDLLEVAGIGSHSASMICFFRMLAKEYFTSEHSVLLEVNNSSSLNRYCRSIFLNANTEQVRCIFLDDDLNLISEKKITEGTIGKVELPVRLVVEAVIKAKSNRIVLSHNHPVGSCMPSKNDIECTFFLWETLKKIQIELIDHVIVGIDGEWSMRFNNSLPEVWNNY